MVRIPAVAIFKEIIFKENFVKIRVKVRVILGKEMGKAGVEERGEAKIVAWRNNLATFDSQQLATLWKLGLGSGLDCNILAFSTENNKNKHLIFGEFHGR